MIMDCKSMNITTLPYDCFYYILQFLSIEDRRRMRLAFPMFESSFIQMDNVTKNSKALGINQLDVDTKFSNSRRNLYSRFKLHERWACSDHSHIPQQCFSSNKILKNKIVSHSFTSDIVSLFIVFFFIVISVTDVIICCFYAYSNTVQVLNPLIYEALF